VAQFGNGAKIGAGSVVIQSVPEGATVVGIPARIAGIRKLATPLVDLEHRQLPDLVIRAINDILERENQLEARIQDLESPPAGEFLQFRTPPRGARGMEGCGHEDSQGHGALRVTGIPSTH